MADETKPTAPRRPRATTAKPRAPRKTAAAASAAASAPKRAPGRPKKAPQPQPSRTDAWREQAGTFADQAMSSARSAATTAKNSTGSALHGLSKVLADTADTVDERFGAQYGNYARQAAGTVAGAADSLDAKNIDQLAEEAREFVRKSPAVAIGAAALVGFVLVRMLRGGSDES